MISSLDRLARLCPSLLAALIVCLLPTALRAQSVVFRNECQASVAVQTATVVRGVLLRDTPYVLRSMEATPRISLAVNKILFIYDARSNRLLYRDVLRATRANLAYGIEASRLPGRVQVSSRRAETVTPGTADKGKRNRGKMTP